MREIWGGLRDFFYFESGLCAKKYEGRVSFFPSSPLLSCHITVGGGRGHLSRKLKLISDEKKEEEGVTAFIFARVSFHLSPSENETSLGRGIWENFVDFLWNKMG